MDPEEIKAQINEALKPLLEKLEALETENKEIRDILKNANLPKTINKPHTAVSTHINSKNAYKVDKKPVVVAGKNNETGHKPVHEKKEEPKSEKKVEDANSSQGAANSEHTEVSQKKCLNICNLEQPPVKPTIGAKPTTAVKKPITPAVDVGKKNPPTATKTPVVGHKGPSTNTKIKTETAQDEEKNLEESGKKKSISKVVDKPNHDGKAHLTDKTHSKPGQTTGTKTKQTVDNVNAKKEVVSGDKKSEKQNGVENDEHEKIEKKEEQVEVTDKEKESEQKENTNEQPSEIIEEVQPETVQPETVQPEVVQPEQNLQSEEETKNKDQAVDPTSEHVKETQESPEVGTKPVESKEAEDAIKNENKELQADTEISTEKKAEDESLI